MIDSKVLAGYRADRERRRAADERLARLADEAWERFAAGGFPVSRRGSELWKYTNPSELNTLAFRAARPAAVEREWLERECPWHDGWITVVLVDGVFQPQLSRLPAGGAVDVRPLADAPELVEAHFGGLADAARDQFCALNTAFAADGVAVRVAGGAGAATVQVLNVTSLDSAPSAGCPRLLMVLEEGATCNLIESFINGSGAPHLTAAVSELVLKQGANLTHRRVQLERGDSFHAGMVRVRQAGDTKFDSLSYASAPKMGRYDLHVALEAPGGECRIQGLYLTTGEQHQSNEIGTTHSTPHCTSEQFFKGVLSGRSQAVFSGKVIVKPGAIKTEAAQKDLNLLLSRGAEIDTKPSLEIYADDVVCGHGATAGHIDPAALFYMRSRGIDELAAMTLLANGFASEIVDQFEDDHLRKYLERRNSAVMNALLEQAEL